MNVKYRLSALGVRLGRACRLLAWKEGLKNIALSGSACVRRFFVAILLQKFGNWTSNQVLEIAVALGPWISAHRISRGRPRSLWGVTPILTLPLKARADRALGFRSESLVYTTYVTTSDFDVNLQALYMKARALGVLAAFQRLVLAYALLRYDVFHTFADCGLFDARERLRIDPAELKLWQAAGKRVYVYAYGADVRTREKTLALGRWNFCSDCTEPRKYCICLHSEGQKSIEDITKYATASVSLGDMLTYMPDAKHINYWPIDLDRVGPAPRIEGSGPLRIAHAPNHTHFKGSRYLEQVIEKLKARGHSIEYFKVQGVPNKQVMSLFATCDVIADQFIGGAYGYTALEAMALGRPVLSYVRSADLVEAPEECPIINTNPDTLEEVLIWVLENRDHLPAIGEQGRHYVERWHTIEAVASRLGELYGETARFPRSVIEKIERQGERETDRRNSVSAVVGWEHPYQVTRSDRSPARRSAF